MSKVKILVLGSGGFILSNFIRMVLKNYSGYEIVSIDKCTNKKVLNTIYSNKGHTLHVGDISDSKFMDVIFDLEKPDYVIHGAVEYDGSDMLKTNILGTQVVIDACIKYNVKKLIYLSTVDVLDTSVSLLSCDPKIYPVDKFGATKASAELLIQVSSLNYNIIRAPLVYGPRQYKYGLIPYFIDSIVNNKEIVLDGDGMTQLDCLFVQDLCSAIMSVLELGILNETIHVTSSQEIYEIELINKIASCLDVNFNNIKFGSLNKKQAAIDSSSIRSLGWVPAWKLKDGINHTVSWYDRNKWFLR
jgi:dTDP-glucose 4,6-dehydratase